MDPMVIHMNPPRLPFTEELARVVASEMHKRGITIRSLATDTGIPFVTLTRRLNPTANSPFNAAELDRIATVLGVRPSDLAVAAEAGLDAECAS